MLDRLDTVFPAEADLPARLQLWRPEARAELLTHLAELGLTDIQRAAEDIVAREAERARAVDPRVRDSDARRFQKLARRAQSLAPAPHTFLSGFTRGIDGKLRLSAELFNGLVQALAVEERSRLLAAIESGPPGAEVAWSTPRTSLELIAGLVRHLLLQPEASLRLSLDVALAHWLGSTFDALGVGLEVSAGGVGLFVANLTGAFPQVRALSFASRPLSPALAARCGPRVQLVCPDGAVRTAGAWADTAEPAPVSFCLEYTAFDFEVLGRHELALLHKRPEGGDLQRRSLRCSVRRSGRVVLATPNELEPSFGDASPAVLRGIGGETDTFFFGGAHEYTRGTEAACRARARGLADGVGHLRAGNGRLWAHFEYAPPRNPAHERALLEVLRGTFDSVGLSSAETGPLLERMGVALQRRFGARSPWSEDWSGVDHPGRMLEAGEALVEVMGTRQAQIHGELGDLLVLRDDADVEKHLLALVKSRQVASNKAANPHGEVRSAADLWPVVPTAAAGGLVALHAFADAIAERFALSPVQREVVVERYHYTDRASRLTYLFSPSRGLHHTAGGKTGVGDAIGAVVQLCARVPVRSVATARSA